MSEIKTYIPKAQEVCKLPAEVRKYKAEAQAKWRANKKVKQALGAANAMEVSK